MVLSKGSGQPLRRRRERTCASSKARAAPGTFRPWLILALSRALRSSSQGRYPSRQALAREEALFTPIITRSLRIYCCFSPVDVVVFYPFRYQVFTGGNTPSSDFEPRALWVIQLVQFLS